MRFCILFHIITVQLTAAVPPVRQLYPRRQALQVQPSRPSARLNHALSPVVLSDDWLKNHTLCVQIGLECLIGEFVDWSFCIFCSVIGSDPPLFFSKIGCWSTDPLNTKIG